MDQICQKLNKVKKFKLQIENRESFSSIILPDISKSWELLKIGIINKT